MKILVLGDKQLVSAITREGYRTTGDPGDDLICTVSDTVSFRMAPADVPLIVLLSNNVSDWAAQQERPEAIFKKSPEAILEYLKQIVVTEDIHPAKVQNSVLILTHSNKGGVGKTSTAIALAEVISQKVKTVLCDFDYTAPDIGTFYNLKNELRPVRISENYYVLPAPPGIIPATLSEDAAVNVVDKLDFPVIIGDTSPAPWDKPYLHKLFARCDLVYSIVDQSLFSIEETRNYAPTLLAMGVSTDKIRILVNRYSPKQASIKSIEKAFCAGFKKEVKIHPKVSAVIPEDWEDQLTAVTHKKILNRDIWETVCKEVYKMLGIEYISPALPKSGKFFGFFRKRKDT